VERRPRVLLFCSGGPARSLMAEGFLRATAGQRIICVSAATEVAPPNPLAVQVMAEMGIDLGALKPRTARQALRQSFTHVISICQMSSERCPIYPFARQTYRWDIANPVSEGGADSTASFRRVRDLIAAKVNEFASGAFGVAA